MGEVVTHIINAGGLLDGHVEVFEKTLALALPKLREHLQFGAVDVLLMHEPIRVIPELGLGGLTNDRGDIVTVNIDVSRAPTEANYFSCFYHEFFHVAQLQTASWSYEIKDVICREGAACLFEESLTGEVPIYCHVPIDEENVARLRQDAQSATPRNSRDWLFGFDDVPKWFGYSYGYQLCKEYADKHALKPEDLLNIQSAEIWGD